MANHDWEKERKEKEEAGIPFIVVKHNAGAPSGYLVIQVFRDGTGYSHHGILTKFEASKNIPIAWSRYVSTGLLQAVDPELNKALLETWERLQSEDIVARPHTYVDEVTASKNKWILVDKKPVLEPNPFKYAAWFRNNDNRVAEDYIGDRRIVTSFIGLETSMFETMVSEIPLAMEVKDGEEVPPVEYPTDAQPHVFRYSTWEEAEAGHRQIVAKIANGELIGP